MLRLIPTKKRPVICWWSGGITSAVACKIASDIYGVENCRFIFLDTRNEDDDTYRFMKDCEGWYGREIESMRNEEYDKIQDVWYKFNSLNVAYGAVCSSELKRKVRQDFQKENDYSYQVFGFDVNEINRAKSMKLNYPDSNPIFPLLIHGLSKEDCITIVQDEDIEIPAMYKMGFQNNNCRKTGCVQGGIGYWQHMREVDPEVFENMAKVEHDLTDRKGEPVTMLKDQAKGGGLLFLKPHPDYPHIKDISMKKGRKPKKLVECNGFCGIDDLDETDKDVEQINFQTELAL